MTMQPAAASLEKLLPIVATHRREADRNRHLASQVVDAVRASGLLGMPVAPAQGGLGTSLPEMLQVYEAIAHEDAAVSWVIWNAGLIGFCSRYMTQALKDELFTGCNKLICQSTIPAGELETQDAEAVIRGRWPLMSGSPGADWAVLTCRKLVNGKPVVDASGTPELVLAAVPRESFEIIDTWHSSGLRGTGSNDIEVAETRVPTHRTFSIAQEAQVTGPTDRLPIFACVSAIFAAQSLGVARAVYDHALDRGQSTVTPGPMPDPRDRQDYQIAIAQHGEALAVARQQLQAAARPVWDQADAGRPPSRELSTGLYAAAFFVIHTAKAAVDALHGLSGTSGLYEDSPIEKPARDLHSMMRHIVAQPVMQADVGRVRLGLEPEWPLFFI
ncbi:MAG: acyl-CoA dehydrogenase family protein [Pseudomonadota bacterium]